ncbi:hypothetical protein LT85_0095 [Collimonas arenae]|uniref:Uncharacterized protein n=1 Tax=Collimonas arenae TaxID=279058 RepID=A0A0A1F663_9BURK|nr:hypothetical protein LT85_0095 [Collimonas arenae]
MRRGRNETADAGPLRALASGAGEAFGVLGHGMNKLFQPPF